MKSITFFFFLFVGVISFACKQKAAEEMSATGQTTDTLATQPTADEKQNAITSLGGFRDAIQQRIQEAEKRISDPNQKNAAQMRIYVDELKKGSADIQALMDQIASSGDGNWKQAYDGSLERMHELKALLAGENFGPNNPNATGATLQK